jgi:hypothetical protein
MVNFYRSFLPGIPRTLQLLTDALKGAPKTLELPQAADAFRVANVVSLVHPAPNAVLSLATDASDTHVGGMLQQLSRGSWQPLAFYSKKLSRAGTRYSTFDRELLAAFSAVRHFSFLLEGRPPPGQPTSPALAAEDWPDEGLAAPEQPILAAIANAQLIDFATMAAAQ